MGEVSGHEMLHQHYYDTHVAPSLQRDAAEDWEYHTLLIVTPGLGVELMIVCHLLRTHTHVSVVLVGGSDPTSHVADVLRRAFSTRCLFDPHESHYPAVTAIEEGATPTQRCEAYHSVGGVIVVHSRTLVADILARRVDTTAIGGVVVWEAHEAPRESSFALALLRDFDCRALRLLARVSEICKETGGPQITTGEGPRGPLIRCVLSTSTCFSAINLELITALNPTAIKLVPVIERSVQTWLASRPSVTLLDDRVTPHPLSRRCAAALVQIVNEMLCELASCGPQIDTELESYASGHNTPKALCFASLAGGQLDPFLSRLAHQEDYLPLRLRSSGGTTAKEIATNLEDLRRFVFYFPISNPASFALRVEGALRDHRRRARNHSRAGDTVEPPLWMFSRSSDEFVTLTMERVIRSEPVLRPSDAITGRFRYLRELLASASRERARDPSNTLPPHDVVIVVADDAGVRDATAAVWAPTLEDLERDMLLDFARRYRQPLHVGPDTTFTVNDVACEGADAQQQEEADGADTAPTDAKEDLQPTQCSITVHEQLLNLDISGLCDLSQPQQRLTQTPPIEVGSDDDEVLCLGACDGNSNVVLVGPSEPLFHRVVIESVTASETVILCESSLRITIVARHNVDLSWLLHRDPRHIVVLDANVAVFTALQLFAAHRSVARGWSSVDVPSPVVRRVGEHYNDVVLAQQRRKACDDGGEGPAAARGAKSEPLEWDNVRFEVRAERAALVRVGELRGASINVMRVSGRQRRAVENEVSLRSAPSAGRYLPSSDATTRPIISPSETQEPLVIFDQRELRGPLPSELFRAGLRIIPVTLLIGDYVLSDAVAIERKALRDLCQSVLGGRIVPQLRALTGRYPHAVLLVEFALREAFRLRLTTFLRGTEEETARLAERIARVVGSFPRLSVMWARSPPHAADLVSRLKNSIASSNPDVSDPSLTSPTESSHREETDKALEMLQRLPGVTAGNCRALMDAVGSLAGLHGASLTDLCRAMGETQGSLLHAFLHGKHRQRSKAPCEIVEIL